MKKGLSFLLALALSLCLCMPAFAEKQIVGDWIEADQPPVETRQKKLTGYALPQTVHIFPIGTTVRGHQSLQTIFYNYEGGRFEYKGNYVDGFYPLNTAGELIRMEVSEQGSGMCHDVFFMAEDVITAEHPSNQFPTGFRFRDVKEGSYFYHPVAWALQNGMVTGTTSTLFEPFAPCTQAQILMFLWRASGMPQSDGYNPFPSVTRKDYYYDAVVWAYEEGIIDLEFNPVLPCSRASAISYIYRNEGSPAVHVDHAFTDVREEDAAAVQWALNEKITRGKTESSFAPDDICNRAQIVTFLYRQMCL